jgi:hypothetical protein
MSLSSVTVPPFGDKRATLHYERSSERFYALAMLACSVICFNTLQQPP